MASIVKEGGERRRIEFTRPGFGRVSIRLGAVTPRVAQEWCSAVEELLTANRHGQQPPAKTLAWVASLSDDMHAKLSKHGLVQAREGSLLSSWLDKYLSRSKLKTTSKRKLEQTKAKLLAFFDTPLPLRSITRNHASEWADWLEEQKLSRATIKIHCGNAKTFLNEAERRGLVDQSPFDHLTSGNTPSKETHYVDPDTIAAVIDHCPTVEWKLMFGLARYGGLRVPSETHLLTWADIDMGLGRITVHSPKTERYEGHEKRVIPIDRRLRELLLEAISAKPKASDHLVAIRGKGAVRRRVEAICKQAKVTIWPRLWQSLRSSCEKEWAMAGLPQFAVSKWIGHSITVSGLHYANSVPDELYGKVAFPAQQIAQRHDMDGLGMECKQEVAKSLNNLDFKGIQSGYASCRTPDHWSRRELNRRPSEKTARKSRANPPYRHSGAAVRAAFWSFGVLMTRRPRPIRTRNGDWMRDRVRKLLVGDFKTLQTTS